MRRVIDHGFRFIGKPGYKKTFSFDELYLTGPIVAYPHVVVR
ncbi:MAG: hypothetical protein Q8M64_18660 [Methyloversatilis sp.]|nr:hypothetical protein [Methyloversatilis sp.]